MIRTAASDDDSDSDYDYTDAPPHTHTRTHTHSHTLDNTVNVLFEKSPGMKLFNELSPNKSRESAFTGRSSSVVLTHTMTKRDRCVQFVIREHDECSSDGVSGGGGGVSECGSGGGTSFSVHVHGSQQRYSFLIPSLQV
jgi:hypothetical protein